MNAARAKEISESGQAITVTFQGSPVMIQHVDEQAGTARVYFTSQPEQEQTVALSSLQEQA